MRAGRNRRSNACKPSAKGRRIRLPSLTTGRIPEQARRAVSPNTRSCHALDRYGVVVKFHSQVGQDRFLLENFFRGKRGGVFVDIGAYDGETFSNSLFFERTMGWTGLCVEPLPSAFQKLKATRKAICENVCVAEFEGAHLRFMQQLSVARTTHTAHVTRLSKLLDKHKLFHIDYCSIDTEGAE